VNIKLSVLIPELVGANFTLTVHQRPRASCFPAVHPDFLIVKSVPFAIVTEPIVIKPRLRRGLISLTLALSDRPTLTRPNEIEVREIFAMIGCGVEVGIGVGV